MSATLAAVGRLALHKTERMFTPFTQRSKDRFGLGLGCNFTTDLPR